MQGAFAKVDSLNEHVNAGRYDLIGPTGEVITPERYDTLIQPGWTVTMRMQPLPELLPSPSILISSRSSVEQKTPITEDKAPVQELAPRPEKESTMSPGGEERTRTPDKVVSPGTGHLHSSPKNIPLTSRPVMEGEESYKDPSAPDHASTVFTSEGSGSEQGDTQEDDSSGDESVLRRPILTPTPSMVAPHSHPVSVLDTTHSAQTTSNICLGTIFIRHISRKEACNQDTF